MKKLGLTQTLLVWHAWKKVLPQATEVLWYPSLLRLFSAVGDRAGASVRAKLRICGVDEDFFRPGRALPFDDLRFRENAVEEMGELLLEPSCGSRDSLFTNVADVSGTLLEMETGEGPKGIMLVANMFPG